VNGEWVSARYLATLGITPALGGDFPADEDTQQGDARRLVVISNALFKRRFNADPAAVGKTIDVDGAPFEVVGVLPASFTGLSGRADVLIPITTRSPDGVNEPWSLEFSQIGRLKPGLTLLQATAETRTLGKAVDAATPMVNMIGSGTRGAWGADARPLGDTRVAPTIRRSLLVLFGAVGYVLLIACVNLANLLMGRATSRTREIAVRLAVGARRGRLVRLLLTESVVLSLIGGVVSVLVAWWGTRALASVNPAAALQAQGLSGLGIVGFATIRLDVAALAFALGVALLVGVLFGLVPALHATRVSLQHHLKDGDAAPRVGGRLGSVTGRRILVVTEIALALVLLAGAGLMLRSLDNRMRVNPGFDASNLLTLRLNISSTRVPRDSIPGFYELLLERMRGLPGVERAGIADCPPLNGGCNATVITFPDRPPVAKSESPSIGVHVVTPEWFQTMRVPLKRGRLLAASDGLHTPKSIVISESAARRYWPNEDPLGTRAGIWQGGFQDGATVVGIVGDVRYGTIDSLPQPDVYMSYGQAPRPRMMIFLRTKGDPDAVARMARAVAHELSPNYPAYDVRSMSARVAAATTQARLSALLLTLFAGVALALAVVGIYGVLSFAVAQRTREIGIRMALGADRRTVLRLVIGEGVALAAVGAGLGLVTALVLARILGSLLYDVTPSDPKTYVAIVGLLGTAAAVASWLPARRAARLDPVEALRKS
jgi:predicted permease